MKKRGRKKGQVKEYFEKTKDYAIEDVYNTGTSFNSYIYSGKKLIFVGSSYCYSTALRIAKNALENKKLQPAQFIK